MPRKSHRADGALYQIRARVRHYGADIDEYRRLYGKDEGERRFFREHTHDEEVVTDGNLLMTAGADAFIKALQGTAITNFNNANSYLGVGDSSTAEAANQTDLQAATNKARQAMDGGYPTHTAGTNSTVYSATFGTGSANFVWAEWGLFNASTAGVMLNRKVAALGTKSTGSWQLQVTLTLS